VRFKVRLTGGARRDIQDIYRYIADNDSAGRADYVAGGLEKACAELANFPARGNYPKELLLLGIQDYREAHFKPYRIVYQIIGRTVFVHCVLDGRRDMQPLLQRRLLR